MSMDVTNKACRIRSTGDLYMDAEARPFLGENCRAIRQTKAGLVQVSLEREPARVYSFALKAIEWLDEI